MMKLMFLVFKLVINNKNKIINNLIKILQTNFLIIINKIPTFKITNSRNN